MPRISSSLFGGRTLAILLALACAGVGVALLASPGSGGPAAPAAPEGARAAEGLRPGAGGQRSRSAPREARAQAVPRPERRLSNEFTRSRWAYVRRPTVARVEPAADAAAVVEVGLRTSVDTPELVLALAETRAEDGRRWVEVRLPVPPNGQTGWVPRRDLERFYTVTTALRIDRERRVATLYDRGERVWQAPVGIGTRRWPTPAGDFYVRSRIVPVEAGGGFDRGGTYGVFAFGTSGYAPELSDGPGGGVIGIHGTDQPELLPGRVSHGCVRLENRDIARLRQLMPLGTPIEVQ